MADGPMKLPKKQLWYSYLQQNFSKFYLQTKEIIASMRYDATERFNKRPKQIYIIITP